MKPRVKFDRHNRYWYVLWKGRQHMPSLNYVKTIRNAIHIANYHHRKISAH